jgi:hypothetical protein
MFMVSEPSQRMLSLMKDIREANSSPTYYERFKEAFVNEVNTFTDAVLDDKRKYLLLLSEGGADT